MEFDVNKALLHSAQHLRLIVPIKKRWLIMSFKRVTTSVAVVLALLSAPIASSGSAFAGGGHYRGGYSEDYGYAPRHYAPQYGYAPRHYAPQYGYRYHERHHRDRTGDAIGAAVLGIGALIIGSAIANGSRRHHRRY